MTLPPLPAHHALISQKTPEWMKNATPATYQALRDSLGHPPPWFGPACLANPEVGRQLQLAYARHLRAEARWRTLLGQLPSLQAFARPRLAAAIKTRFGLVLDVERTFLFNASLAAAYRLQSASGRDALGGAQTALKRATRSLLHCALQNFSAAQAQPGGLDQDELKAVVLDSDLFIAFSPQGKAVAMAPDAFAELVRELDLGGQYQQLIRAVFAPPVQALAIAKASQAQALLLQTHLALLQGGIDRAWHDALVQLLDGRDSPLRCTLLKLWEVELTGLVVISQPRDEAERVLPVVVYIPDDPVAPLKAYPSTQAFASALRDRLLEAHYLAFFQRFIPARSQAPLNARLQDRLTPWTKAPGTTWYQRLPDPNATLHLRETAVQQPLLSQLANQKARRVQDDALFHAVPTAQMDERSLEQHLAYFAEGALQILNVAGFFVPGLGALMLGVAALQLGYEVFEGIESWARDEQDQALGYLLDVVENLAVIAALGAAGSSGAAPALEHVPVETPSFIEDLGPVQMPDGSTRLWKPDLQPFAHDILLPPGLVPDEFGLYHYQGKTWLALEDRMFALAPGKQPNGYALVHPSRVESYAPAISHNGAGAWLHALDRPHEWAGQRLFARLGPLGAGLDQATATRILQISDCSEAVLRRALAEQARLPAQLHDTLVRYRLDAELPADLSRAERLARFDRAYAQLQANAAGSAALLQRVYPQLPFAWREELLRGATAAERQQLADGRIPLRLAEEIRACLPHVRLSRALEGLLIPAARNADTDRVILRMVQRLPGWSPDVRIEVRANAVNGRLLDSIGPAHATIIRRLARHAEGYSTFEADGRELHGIDSLFAALAHALPDAQRNALGVPGAWDGARLAQLVSQAPLPPRAVLREALALPPAVPGYMPPMRLASGRLGYLLSGKGAMRGYILRETLLDGLRMLGLHEHLAVPVERILEALEQSAMPREQILARLHQLIDERQQLDAAMDAWGAQSAALLDPDARALSRSRIGLALWRHWYHNCLPEIPWLRAPLRLEQAWLEDFPATLPGFIYARARHLHLHEISVSPGSSMATLLSDWRSVQAFLARFTQVTELHISRPTFQTSDYSPFQLSLSQLVQGLPGLTALRFINQSAVLLSHDLQQLAGLAGLRELDLSGNSLVWAAGDPWPDLHLRYLGLERMGLRSWPAWLGPAALARLEAVSLQGNALDSLPAFLLDNPAPATRHTRLALADNHLFGEQAVQLALNPGSAAHRYHIELGPQRHALYLSPERERQQLREMLEHWALSASASAAPSDAAVLRRTALSERLLAFWELFVQTGYHGRLALTDISLQDPPPRLPGFFANELQGLMLTRVDVEPALLDAWLQRFPDLTQLHLENLARPLQRLPGMLAGMPRLRELTLVGLGLQVDQALLDTLAQLAHLSLLDLSGNRIGSIAQLPAALAPRLGRLYLNGCALAQWPAWVEGFSELRVLGLDRNLISELPPQILANPYSDAPLIEVSLRDNPLTHATMQQAYLSEGHNRRYAFVMDLPEDIQALPHGDPFDSSSSASPGSSHGYASEDDEQQAPVLQPWLLDSVEENQLHQQTWQRLEQTGPGNTLLRLVERLRQSAPFRDARLRQGFARRVWQVLQRAADDSAERELYAAMAEAALVQADGSQTCHDGAHLVFNQIELRLFSEQAMAGIADDQRGPALLQLVRRLYRLQALDDIAVTRLAGRDEAEVRLAYRMRLASELDLPVPPGSMLYEATANVSSLELSQVLQQVRQGEHGAPLLDFAAANPAWVAYLRSSQAARFEQIEASYRRQVEALPERFPALTLEQLGPRFSELEQERHAAEQGLIRELTAQARQPR